MHYLQSELTPIFGYAITSREFPSYAAENARPRSLFHAIIRRQHGHIKIIWPFFAFSSLLIEKILA